MTEVTIESLQAEITRLKAHSDDLLAERKAEKQQREAAENALQTLTGERDGLLSRLDELTLTGPVLRALESVVAMSPVQGRRLLEETGIKFALGKEGTAVAIDGETEVPLPDLYQHLSRKSKASAEGAAALDWILRSSGASGGGAMGSNGQPFNVSSKESKVITATHSLGLR